MREAATIWHYDVVCDWYVKLEVVKGERYKSFFPYYFGETKIPRAGSRRLTKKKNFVTILLENKRGY